MKLIEIECYIETPAVLDQPQTRKAYVNPDHIIALDGSTLILTDNNTIQAVTPASQEKIIHEFLSQAAEESVIDVDQLIESDEPSSDPMFIPNSLEGLYAISQLAHEELEKQKDNEEDSTTD